LLLIVNFALELPGVKSPSKLRNNFQYLSQFCSKVAEILIEVNPTSILVSFLPSIGTKLNELAILRASSSHFCFD